MPTPHARHAHATHAPMRGMPTCSGSTARPSPSRSMYDFLRSTPTVARVVDTKRPSEKRVSTDVFPTAASPSKSSLTLRPRAARALGAGGARLTGRGGALAAEEGGGGSR